LKKIKIKNKLTALGIDKNLRTVVNVLEES